MQATERDSNAIVYRFYEREYRYEEGIFWGDAIAIEKGVPQPKTPEWWPENA